ncbi:MAG: Gfo/Idh/MocA family oxidoreductase [Planctomycetota bacterium]|nr:Gfo/Idh/MocA family oxidoreductase [Planctomycetota bacterium]
MSKRNSNVSRRQFLQTSVLGLSAVTIVPRSVLGGPGQTPPSETLGAALIGCGGRGGGTFGGLGPNVRKLAECDVRFADRVDNKTIYTDFRRVLERLDIDVVAIATPPGWHALISIAAMEAGKDVLCEKPMARFIAEGRAVVDAERRYGRIFQIGTFGRFGANRQTHKLMASGLLKTCPAVVFRRGFKIKEWSGIVNPKPQLIPKNLDWDMYCGPAPLRPYHPHRVGGTHRGYWDYEGGGLADMAQHHLDGFNYEYAKDFTSPVEIEAYAPPAHPEAVALWGWVELTYADGLTLVLDGAEWGPRYDRKTERGVGPGDLSEADQKKLKELPDPERLVSFPEAVKTRQRAGGHAEAAHRTATLFHLANVAIRSGRKLRYDPVKEEIIGDEEANRLVRQPMRAPWRL